RIRFRTSGSANSSTSLLTQPGPCDLTLPNGCPGYRQVPTLASDHRVELAFQLDTPHGRTDFSSSRQVLLTQQEPIPVGDIRVRWSPTPSVLEPEHRYDLQLDYTPVQDYIFVYALWLYKLNAQGQPDAASAVRWNLNGEPGA